MLFALGVVLPGALLAVLGAQAWLQERQLAEQQLRERVDRAADAALRAFEVDVRAWQALIVRAGQGSPPALESVEGPVRAALDEPGSGALAFLGATPRVWPATQAAYTLDQPEAPAALPSPALVAAELVELRDGDHAQAAVLYTRAIPTLPPEDRDQAALRLARVLRKSGRNAEALAIYRRLTSSTARMGGLPVDLVARHELCVMTGNAPASSRPTCDAEALYRDLVSGRWPLTQTRYLFYSESIRGFLRNARAAPLSEWHVVEGRKLALAAVAGALARRSDVTDLETMDSLLVVRTPAAPDVVLLLSRAWLSSVRWPDVFRAATTTGFRVEVQASAAGAWFDSAPTLQASTAAAVRRPDFTGTAWRLRVMPIDAAALMADVTRRRSLTLVMLLLLVAVLASGTYLTTRVVRREMEVARLQSDFVSAVSHEFRSPLTGIRQLGEMLLRGRVPDHRRPEYYERITLESDRLSRLVEHLLDLAQIDAGRRQYRFEPIATADWLRRVVDEARTNPSHRHATIEASIPDGLPRISADPGALGTAVHNLLDNAVKYSPGADMVWCEAEDHGNTVTIRVRDRGVGMTDDDRRVVFERFRRGEGPITAQVKGTGLGLNLVEHIVRAHGGRVECDSRLGAGTTFSIHLPAAPAESGA